MKSPKSRDSVTQTNSPQSEINPFSVYEDESILSNTGVSIRIIDEDVKPIAFNKFYNFHQNNLK